MRKKEREALGIDDSEYERLRQRVFKLCFSHISDEGAIKEFNSLDIKTKFDLMSKLIPFVMTKPDSLHKRDIVDKELRELKLSGYGALFEDTPKKKRKETKSKKKK